MSTSTDGILAFGVDFGESQEGLPWITEELDEEDQAEGGFEEYVYKLAGVPDSYEHWQAYYAWEEGWKTGNWEHDDKGVDVFEKKNPLWRKRLNEIYELQGKATEACPIEEVIHCSYDYSMYIYAISGYVTSASRGYPEIIKTLEVKPEDIQRAKDWCKTAGIPFENPQWILTSLWG